MSNVAESTILAAVFAAVVPWAKSNGGGATMAENPQHAVDILEAGAPGGLHAAVYWESDAEAGEGFPGDTRVNGVVGVALLRPAGLKPRGSETGTALELADGLRAAVLAHDGFDGILGYPAYAGKAPIAVAPGRMLQGYLLRFRFHYAFPTTAQN